MGERWAVLSGGGTVIVDSDTQFVSFVLNADATPGLQLFPVPLMRWTGEFYGHVFAPDVPGFRLRAGASTRPLFCST